MCHSSSKTLSSTRGGVLVSHARERRTILFFQKRSRENNRNRICVKRSLLSCEVVDRPAHYCSTTGESGLVFRINVSSINRTSRSFVALPSSLLMRNALEQSSALTLVFDVELSYLKLDIYYHYSCSNYSNLIKLFSRNEFIKKSIIIRYKY